MNEFERIYYEDPSFWKDETLGKANEMRIQFTEGMVPGDVSTLLDAGCGNGIFCNYLHQKRPEIDVTAMDRSEAALKHVKTRKTVGSLTEIPFEDKSFDCVSCLQVLEHLAVKDFQTSLSELTRVSAKYLLIGVPFEEDLEDSVTQCPSCKTVFNVNLHFRSFAESYFRDLFKDHGFVSKQSENIFKSEKPVGLDSYQKLRVAAYRKKQAAEFLSPICPLCGLVNPTFNASVFDPPPPGEPNASKNLVKKLLFGALPKRTIPGYWIIGLFERKA